MLLFFSPLLSLLAFILFAIFIGGIALVLGAFWLYSKKYNPKSLPKLKYLAVSLRDALFAIIGTFIILVVVGVAVFFINAIAK